MDKKFKIVGNMDFFLDVSAKDKIQARNQVLKLLNGYRNEIEMSVNAMDILEVVTE